MGIMKASIIRDIIKRSKIHVIEEKQQCLKSLKHNKKLGLIWWSRHKLSGLPSRKVNTRCIITSRGKSVNQTFKLSRLELRRWASIKILPGVITGSW
jgi:ribosomal protein S14